MSFSKEWEDIYCQQLQLCKWPWSDLISYVMRYARPKDIRAKILELGFGAGANIPFYKSLNADFYGIEGSETVVAKVKDAYPEYSKNLICGDFTKEILFDNKFDIIIDRASITHNSTETIKNTIKLIKEKLNKDGKFIGIDWFATDHSEFDKNGELIDNNTKILNNGYFAGVGEVHFSDDKHIKELFNDFKIINLKKKFPEIMSKLETVHKSLRSD